VKVSWGRSAICINVNLEEDGPAVTSIRRELSGDRDMACNLITTHEGDQVVITMFPNEDVSADTFGRIIRVLTLVQSFLNDSKATTKSTQPEPYDFDALKLRCAKMPLSPAP